MKTIWESLDPGVRITGLGDHVTGDEDDPIATVETDGERWHIASVDLRRALALSVPADVERRGSPASVIAYQDLCAVTHGVGDPATREGLWTVPDFSGGRWWPKAAARLAISEADDPGAEAVRLCVTDPTSGEWTS